MSTTKDVLLLGQTCLFGSTKFQVCGLPWRDLQPILSTAAYQKWATKDFLIIGVVEA